MAIMMRRSVLRSSLALGAAEAIFAKYQIQA